ncbi:MAG: ribosome assembly factor SBDS [Methanobacteriota archaeon]|nr:MAG: ribosome assembly factor SBDS [Euryarchaeota archaeon]
MGDLDKAIIGRIEKNGHKFELFLDPDKAYDYLEGKKKDLNNILVAEEVFKDARKGERQSPQALQEAFGTTDIYEILETVLHKGEVQLTTEQKKKMLEKKRKQVIDLIAKEAIDAKTNTPIPPQRIELAMEQAKVHIDPFKKPEDQIEKVISALRPIIPIKMEKVQIAVRVPATYAVNAYSILKSYKIVKEEWGSSGELLALVEIPAGLQGELYDRLGKLTHGEAQTKIIR